MKNVVSSLCRADANAHALSGRMHHARRRPTADAVPAIRLSARHTSLVLVVEADDIAVRDALRSALPGIEAALPQGYRLNVHFAGAQPQAPDMPGHPMAAPPLGALTARQKDVLQLLAKGLSNKQIARQLDLSHFTVRNHISQIMRLFEVSTRQEVAAGFASLGYEASPA